MRRVQPDETYNRLLVISEGGRSPDGYTLFNCTCTCGNTCVVQGRRLVSGHTRSCGCLRKKNDKTQLLSTLHPAEHRAWLDMIQRCENRSNKSWKTFGAKGIEVCARWRSSFALFFEDVGERPPRQQLIRRDSTKNYTPQNAGWARQPKKRR